MGVVADAALLRHKLRCLNEFCAQLSDICVLLLFQLHLRTMTAGMSMNVCLGVRVCVWVYEVMSATLP